MATWVSRDCWLNGDHESCDGNADSHYPEGVVHHKCECRCHKRGFVTCIPPKKEEAK